jgi:hypothetical protein
MNDDSTLEFLNNFEKHELLGLERFGKPTLGRK